MNSKRGFKRITFALAAVAALSGTVIGVSIVINEYENAKNTYEYACTYSSTYSVIPENYTGNEHLWMIETIDKDRWRKMSDLEKIAANKAYNIKSRIAAETYYKEAASSFWIQLSKPSLVALFVAGGLVGAFIGFLSAWLILWFGGLAIYKIIRWLIFGFCDDVSSKQVESMEAGREPFSSSSIGSKSLLEEKGLKMKKELSQKSRQRILVGAWILLILQAMALIGIVSGGDKLYPAVEVFLHRPTAAALGRALGHFVGINTLALVALIAGFTLWRHGKSKESKTIITASTIAIILSSILVIR